MNKIRLVVASLLLGAATGFAQKPFNASGTGNPIIPGYFADPTVKKFGDTYYMYATTDGSGAGFGPAQVWTSKDFVNWTLMPMNWPDSHWIWAPDVMKHTDGNYYYFYCQPCMIHCGVSETPRGPWKNILGESEAVLVPDRFVTNAITLDGQTFVDDDGSVYLYWGTWEFFFFLMVEFHSLIIQSLFEFFCVTLFDLMLSKCDWFCKWNDLTDHIVKLYNIPLFWCSF